MGRRPTIDEATGERLLDAYQRLGNKSAAAREIGVSEDAAARFFAGLPKAAAPALASQQQLIEKAGASLWETRSALAENYNRALRLVEQLERGILEERKGSDGLYVTQTPVATHIAALRELREHIKTAVDLGKLLIDIEQVRIYQQTVIEAIREESPAVADRIIARLRERRAVGLTP